MGIGEVAEDLMGYLWLGPGASRANLGHATFTNLPGAHPYMATVSAVRVAVDAVDDLIAEARTWFQERGKSMMTLWLGPTSTPSSLCDRLLSMGATRDVPVKALYLETEPPTADGVEVRVVQSKEELAAFREIAFEIDELPNDIQDKFRAGIDAAWPAYRDSTEQRSAYLAYLEGEPVASGMLSLTDRPGVAGLVAAACKPHARGKGCYRALVRARWERAIEIGCPTLVTQASPMSAPILQRLGFVEAGDVTVLHLPTSPHGDVTVS